MDVLLAELVHHMAEMVKAQEETNVLLRQVVRERPGLLEKL